MINRTNDLPLNDDHMVAQVRRWIECFVVGLNLCPFAKREMLNNRIRYVSTAAETEAELLMALQAELELLGNDPAIETALLIHAQVLQEFADYNRFLNCADDLLRQMGYEGVYQIASFHPDYRFAGTVADDAENYTNRSPYPMLHIIREESIARAIAEIPGIDQIPMRNIALMNSLGRDKLQALMLTCITDSKKNDAPVD